MSSPRGLGWHRGHLRVLERVRETPKSATLRARWSPPPAATSSTFSGGRGRPTQWGGRGSGLADENIGCFAYYTRYNHPMLKIRPFSKSGPDLHEFASHVVFGGEARRSPPPGPHERGAGLGGPGLRSRWRTLLRWQAFSAVRKEGGRGLNTGFGISSLIGAIWDRERGV